MAMSLSIFVEADYRKVKLMKVNQITYKDAEIQFSMDDLELFRKILKEVRLAIENGGFETRLCWSPRQAHGFLEAISQEIQEAHQNEAKLRFSRLEIIFFNNLLNEICNGIGLSNFEAKIGMSRDEVKQQLDLISELLDKMRSLNEIRRASYLPILFC